ncbi:activating signal cointegrator 1 complex subunit 2 isoform X1 [Anabrus simplex]|uniref:activating signal cointegrator 1 complex subunit 2 isoform X1 n=1 Tax=Anabrus simplex TaxID=316456 RepID=UPI0035A2B87A
MHHNGTQNNDDCKPLGSLTIPHLKDGVLVHVPALHEGWVQTRCYLFYTPPPQQESDGSFLLGAKENWLDTMEFFCQDLEWLLHLEHYRFWSQIVFDQAAMDMVLSFLQDSYPFYMISEFPCDEEMWKMYQNIHRLIFLIINRLATHTESKTDYMTPKLLGELIYNNYIFTIPVLIDLCLIYGQENRQQLMKIINTVFEVQPQYQCDLAKSIGYFTQALLGVGMRLDVPLQSAAEVPTRLKSTKNRLTVETLTDLINHVLDSAISISSLLDIYPPACAAFHQQLFELRIVSFYENTIPELYHKLEVLVNRDTTQELYKKLKTKLEMTRVELLKAFRDMLSSSINDMLVKKDNLSPAEVKAIVDDYVSVLSDCLGDKRFVRDYHKKYPLDQDLDMLAQLCPEMDKLKSDYLLEAALACFDTPPIRKKSERERAAIRPVSPPSQEPEEEAKATKQKVSGVRLDSLITQVKDILPHLGDGFVERCLQYYDYVSDAVVNGVLEGQLPPELQVLDYTLPRIPPEDDGTNEGHGLSLEQEEDDELDKIDYTKSHRGKRKGPYRDLRQMMKDKSHREEFRDLYARLGVVESVDDVYDDEYDDTYDHLDVSVEDEGDLERRPFVVPRVLRQKDDSESSDEEAEVEEDDVDESGPPRDQFVPNPEEIRARAEQRRLARTSHKPKSRDVIGQPKGHGQEKQVTINRSNKTAHKSTRGNHNRRVGAQRKRQQGMVA